MAGAVKRYLWPPFGKVHIARGHSKTRALCGVEPASPWLGETTPPTHSLCARCLKSDKPADQHSKEPRGRERT